MILNVDNVLFIMYRTKPLSFQWRYSINRPDNHSDVLKEIKIINVVSIDVSMRAYFVVCLMIKTLLTRK